MRSTKKIELLAPARDLTTGRVAIDAGADAVYIGGPGFGARRAAGNSLDDVAALVRYARPFGVRVYATLNTLLLDDEVDEARRVARGLVEAGVDALIVQDMAFTRMAVTAAAVATATTDINSSDRLPKVELHASTQTSNISPEDVAFLGRAGFRRVILERALSLEEIRAIRAATPQDIELEVFVHGAICVGYSGRCFLSRSMTGGADGARSGNRGDCSQPCRLAWDLVDGAGNVIIKGKHLLSVRDLDLSGRIGDLLDAGVSSFKIEGRLKDAAYVRNVVSHYRRLIDRELETRSELRRASVGVSTPDFTPDPAKSFTRGGTEYYLDGAKSGGRKDSLTERRPSPKAGEVSREGNNADIGCSVRVASFDTPKAMGEPVGTVGRVGCERTGNRFFTIENPAAQLAAGDGVCFLTGGTLQGTNINRVEGGRVYPNKCEGIAPGVKIYRNYDRAFVHALEHSRMKRRIGVGARVEMNPSRVEAAFADETGVRATAVCEGEFQPANDAAKMAATVREQLSKSGDTIFEVRNVEILGTQDKSAARSLPFVPVSVLTRLRREGLERLFEERSKLPPERHPAIEDMSARFPREKLTAVENVTNRLAGNFWRDHGVTEIERALEMRDALPGEAVMRTRYCIRREIGECPKEGSRLCGDLFLERGCERWRLVFECDKCEMTVTKI